MTPMPAPTPMPPTASAPVIWFASTASWVAIVSAPVFAVIEAEPIVTAVPAVVCAEVRAATFTEPKVLETIEAADWASLLEVVSLTDWLTSPPEDSCVPAYPVTLSPFEA